jgi:hypothetical protein
MGLVHSAPGSTLKTLSIPAYPSIHWSESFVSDDYQSMTSSWRQAVKPAELISGAERVIEAIVLGLIEN